MIARLAGFFACILCACGPVEAAPATARPNIILIVTDDQRWDALGAMGNAIIETPRLDALAHSGVLFSNCFCTTSICATSRASILTGQYARRHGIWDFRSALSEGAFAATFPAMLRAAGYKTAFVGKWGLGGEMPSGSYDSWDGFSGQGRYFAHGDPERDEHLTRQLTAKALRFLDGCSGEQPFCLHIAFKACHCQDKQARQFPYDKRFAKLFEGVRIPPLATATPDHFRRLPPFLQESEARTRWKRRFDGDTMYQESVKDYYRLIAGIDAAVGRVVDRLAEKRLAENTVILFTSDNGFFLGDHGLAGKWFMHDPSIRLPLFVFDPRIPQSARGRTVSQLVLNIDLAPTLVDLAGIAPHPAMQGRSIAPLLGNNAASRRTEAAWRSDFLYEHLFEHPAIPKVEGVRTTSWKYVRYPEKEPRFEELFDLKNDPLEEKNLANEPKQAERLAALRLRLGELKMQAK